MFCRIATGEIPADFVYRDEEVLVFKTIKPAAKTHLLFVPRSHVDDLPQLPDRVLLKIREKMTEVINGDNLGNRGYRIVINGGTAKAIPHLHFHLLSPISVAEKV